jgi:hypothetical protein
MLPADELISGVSAVALPLCGCCRGLVSTRLTGSLPPHIFSTHPALTHLDVSGRHWIWPGACRPCTALMLTQYKIDEFLWKCWSVFHSVQLSGNSFEGHLPDAWADAKVRMGPGLSEAAQAAFVA